MSNLKVLFYDCETSPFRAWLWRVGSKISVGHDQIVDGDRTDVICVAWKWLGESKVHSLNWGLKAQDSSTLIKEFTKVVESADLVIGHNGDAFDTKQINTQRLLHNQPPIAWPTSDDTLKQMRKHFAFPSFKLDYLAKTLAGAGKSPMAFRDWIDIVQYKKAKKLKKMIKYCVAADHKLLRKDMRWVAAKDIKVSDVVLGFDEHGPQRAYKNAVVDSFELEDRPVLKVTLESGKVFHVTPEHKWLIVNPVNNGRVGGYGWKQTKDMRPGMLIPKLFDVWDEDMTKDAGWLSGMYDGEGSLQPTRVNLLIAQNPGIIYDKLVKLIHCFAPGLGSKVTKNKAGICRTIWIRGCLADRLKLLGKLRPIRLLAKLNFDLFGRVEARNGLDSIKSIEDGGVKTIAIISTSTNTFVCDGYPMHNCKKDVLLLEKVYKRASKFFKPKVHAGLHAGIDGTSCPRCSSSNLQKCGFRHTLTGRYQRYVCNECSQPIVSGRKS